jgi:hypothetical protein
VRDQVSHPYSSVIIEIKLKWFLKLTILFFKL